MASLHGGARGRSVRQANGGHVVVVETTGDFPLKSYLFRNLPNQAQTIKSNGQLRDNVTLKIKNVILRYFKNCFGGFSKSLSTFGGGKKFVVNRTEFSIKFFFQKNIF